jgi:hypothetical protein
MPDKYTVRFMPNEPFGCPRLSGEHRDVDRSAVEQYGDLKRARRIGTGPWMLERYEPNVRLLPSSGTELFSRLGSRMRTASRSPSTRSILGSPVSPASTTLPEHGQCVRRLDLDGAKGRKPNLKTQDFTVLFSGITMMKLDREPFKDVRVRRALAQSMNWKDVLETNAWSQGHGVPNPAVPAALKEWAIPINQLTPGGVNLSKTFQVAAASAGGFSSGLKVPVEATLGWSRTSTT